jgi:hypothetical protein
MSENLDSTRQPGRELAVSPQAESRQIAVAALRLLPQGTKLGISVARLSHYVARYHLDNDQVSALVATRRDYKASLPTMMRLYGLGLTVDQIDHLYAVREALKLNHGDGGGQPASISLLGELIETFSLDDLEPETVANELALAHAQISEDSGWIEHMWQTFQNLLETASAFPGISLETAVSMSCDSGEGDDDSGRDDD